ncbi:MAG: hypothetical protein LBM16_00675, partial [Clostridiales bacterium]|nr:hypothetical protein [Clostridiales bacterium]
TFVVYYLNTASDYRLAERFGHFLFVQYDSPRLLMKGFQRGDLPLWSGFGAESPKVLSLTPFT